MHSVVPLWKEAPFLRLVTPFIAGIIVQYFSENEEGVIWILALFAFFCWTVISLTRRLRFTHYYLIGCSIQILFFSAGALLCHERNPFAARSRLESALTDHNLFIARLAEPCVERKSSWKTTASLESIRSASGTTSPSSNILLYFRKDSTRVPPSYGDYIGFIKDISPIKNFDSIGDFDYVRYCALKNIHHQVFLSPGEYVVLSKKKSIALFNLIFNIQQWLVEKFKNYIPDKDARGIALALLMGYKNDLNREIMSAYTHTGIVHVIAISGLHLGIIYGILTWLSKCALRNRKLLKWLQPIFVCAGLWLFTLLAGATPSVLRSAVMFTCIVIGESATRKISLYNNLSASALLLLCIDPFWLFDLGFQLSYIAVLSIVIFYNGIYHLYTPSYRFLDAIWKMNAVTLSAQLLTAPLLLYCFGQFPNLFLLANFIAIPASTIILMGEMLLCVGLWCNSLSILLGNLISYSINMLNEIVAYLDRLPFSSSEGLDISFVQLIMIYIFISFLSAWLILKKRKFLPAAISAAIVFFFIQTVKIW